MLGFRQSDCLRVKVFVFGQSGSIRVKWLYSAKSCCNPVKMVLFGQQWLCSGKSGFIWAKVVVFGQS